MPPTPVIRSVRAPSATAGSWGLANFVEVPPADVQSCGTTNYFQLVLHCVHSYQRENSSLAVPETSLIMCRIWQNVDAPVWIWGFALGIWRYFPRICEILLCSFQLRVFIRVSNLASKSTNCPLVTIHSCKTKKRISQNSFCAVHQMECILALWAAERKRGGN